MKLSGVGNYTGAIVLGGSCPGVFAFTAFNILINCTPSFNI